MLGVGGKVLFYLLQEMSCLPHRSILYPLLEMRAFEHPLHENARGVDGVFVERAGLDNFFYFSDGDLGGHGHQRVEVA